MLPLSDCVPQAGIRWGGILYIGWHVNWQHPWEHIRRYELTVFGEKETNDSKVINNLSKLPFVGRLPISRELLGREEGHGAVCANPNTPSFF